MSKTAINVLTEAANIAKFEVGFLTSFIADKAFRKRGQWRNAEALAALILNSVANAFQCENSDTFEDNGFADMREAIRGYVQANMDDWSGRDWTNKDLTAELQRLVDMVDRNAAFEKREADHADAVIMNAEIDTLSRQLADSRCYWQCETTTRNVQQEHIAKYKRAAFNKGPRRARDIITVIIVAQRIAAKIEGRFEIAQQGGEPVPDLPF